MNHKHHKHHTREMVLNIPFISNSYPISGQIQSETAPRSPAICWQMARSNPCRNRPRDADQWGSGAFMNISSECIHIYIYIYICMYVWIYGWMDVCMYLCMDVWMDGCMDGWMYGWMYVCMYLCMDVWMDGCMDGWTDVCMNI